MIESSIQLSHAQSNFRLVKTCALRIFRAVRMTVREGQRTPGRLQRVCQDVREAWRESAQ